MASPARSSTPTRVVSAAAAPPLVQKRGRQASEPESSSASTDTGRGSVVAAPARRPGSADTSVEPTVRTPEPIAPASVGNGRPDGAIRPGSSESTGLAFAEASNDAAAAGAPSEVSFAGASNDAGRTAESLPDPVPRHGTKFASATGASGVTDELLGGAVDAPAPEGAGEVARCQTPPADPVD
ncbi:MAG TPA: hypothetical protein PLI18_00165, partial [Pirellulaceae bacterium]|nr:hypothetical protein [Pirellulaceae bacterium]